MHYFRVVLVLLLPVLIVAQSADIQTDDTEVTPAKKLYAKGNILMGVGFDKVFGGYKYVEGEDPEKINIYPGGGVGVEAVLGYDITPTIAAEVGIAMQSSGQSVSNGHVYFRKVPYRASLLYKPKSTKSYRLYFGGGLSSNFSAKYDVEEDDSEATVTYTSAMGFHGLAGANFHKGKSPIYFAGEVRYVSMADYEMDEAELDGHSFVVATDKRELSAGGVHFVFTMGYYLR
jgi:hypothetical protein